MKFAGSLPQNDNFGSFLCENCRKHRAKRSFWKLCLSNLEEASHETIILEAFSVKIAGASQETIIWEASSVGLARNDHFGSFCSTL